MNPGSIANGDNPGEWAAMAPLDYILLRNWHGLKGTLDCFDSASRLDYPALPVVVSDIDGDITSFERIQASVDGLQEAPAGALRKPVPRGVYDRAQAGGGGLIDEQAPLVLARTRANLGFTTDNCVDLRFTQADADHGYAWLSNNDTLVDINALSELMVRMRRSSGVGICNSKRVFYQ